MRSYENVNDLFEEPKRDAADIAAITSGRVVLAGRLFGIIYSSIRIRRTKQDRRAICISRNDGYWTGARRMRERGRAGIG
ncbi:MAG: hypothetical protein AAGF92_06710 [Myxococcota bacterium]